MEEPMSRMKWKIHGPLWKTVENTLKLWCHVGPSISLKKVAIPFYTVVCFFGLISPQNRCFHNIFFSLSFFCVLEYGYHNIQVIRWHVETLKINQCWCVNYVVAFHFIQHRWSSCLCDPFCKTWCDLNRRYDVTPCGIFCMALAQLCSCGAQFCAMIEIYFFNIFWKKYLEQIF